MARLYSYLIGQMHTGLNAAFAEAERARATAASQPTVRSQAAASARSTGSATGAGTAAEAPLERLRRVAAEAETVGAWDRAAAIHAARVALAEDAAAKGETGGRYNGQVWLDYGMCLTRRGPAHWVKAVACLREAVSIGMPSSSIAADANADDAARPEHLPALLALAAVQAARGQIDEAAVFSYSALKAAAAGASAHLTSRESLASARGTGATELPVDTPRTDMAANLLPLSATLHSLILTMMATAQGKPDTSSGAAVEAGKALRAGVEAYARCLLWKATAGRAADDADEAESAARQAATPGGVYLILSRFLLDLQLQTLARRALALAADALLDTDAPAGQRLELLTLRARHYLQQVEALRPQPLVESAKPVAGRAVDYQSSTATEIPSSSGRAYDGTILTAAEALRTLERAAEQQTGVSSRGSGGDGGLSVGLAAAEAWSLLAAARLQMHTATAQAQAGAAPHASAHLAPAWLPDLADVPVEAVEDALRCWNMAANTHAAAVAAVEGTGSLHGLQPAERASLYCSASGVGGGLLASDAYSADGVTKAWLSLAGAHLHLAARSSGADDGDSNAVSPTRAATGAQTVSMTGAAASLRAAREAYLRAASAGSWSSGIGTSGSGEIPTICPWALALLGVGRAAWALGDAVAAEAAFSKANQADNQVI